MSWQDNYNMTERLFAKFESMGEQAKDIAREFNELLMANPRIAFNNFRKYLGRAEDINENSAFVKAVAGGTDPALITPLFNIYGKVYASLDKKLREDVLVEILHYLNKLNYFVAQDYVAMLHAPMLVADIVISSGMLYWPGYAEYAEKVKDKKDWNSFEKTFWNSDSIFLCSYAILRNKYSNKSLREEFYKTYPDILDSVLDGLAALKDNDAKGRSKQGNLDFNSALDEELLKFDEELKPALLEKIKKNNWIDLSGICRYL